jgi:ATP/maltotriose-dependent transcriptional regulator MalT
LGQGQYAKAINLNEAAQKRYQELNYRSGISNALMRRMTIAWEMGDYPLAKRLGSEVIEEYPADDPGHRRQTSYLLGRIAMAEGNLNQAESLLIQSNSLLWPGSYCFINLVAILLGWAALFHKQDRPLQAARILGAAETVFQCEGFSLAPRERSEQAETLAAVRSSLSEADFDQAWKAGQAMTLEQAVAFILAEVEPK